MKASKSSRASLSSRPWLWMVGLGALCAACAGRGGDSTTGGGGSGGTGTGSGGTSGSGNVGVTPTASAIGAPCTTSQPAPPLLRRLTTGEYQATLTAIFPPVDATAITMLSSLKLDSTSKLSFQNDAALLLVGPQKVDEVRTTAESVAAFLTDPARLNGWLPCAAAGDAACASSFVSSYGKRLFRRPLTDAEKTSYGNLWKSISDKAGFAIGLKWTLAALLQSPSMLYRSEIGARSGSSYKLSQYEIATELAYDFGGVPPDDALLAKADGNQLGTPDVLVAEAQRLLATPSGRDMLHTMFRQWARYDRKFPGDARDTDATFPATWPSMQEETMRFVDEVVVTRGGGVKELLTAPFTVMNAALAAYYKYGTAGSSWAVVDRPPTWGIGILAQGAFLSGHAYQTSTSPTQRGLTIFERYLCNDRPTPPAGVPTISAPMPGVKTTRQRYEDAHIGVGSADPGKAFCATCHTQFDPVGFAFEHFDQSGKYRDTESNLPIVTTGYLPKPNQSTTFDGEAGLAQVLAQTPLVSSCIGGLLESFVFGGAGGQVCLAADPRQALISGQIGLLEFLTRLAGSPSFGTRVPAN